MPFTEFNKLDSFRLRERLPVAMGGTEIFHVKSKKNASPRHLPF